jgi:type I restriction enzyme S subunit
VSDWITTRIRELVAVSCPGDWGTDSGPEDGTPVLRSTNFRNDGTIDYSDIACRNVEDSRLDKRRVVSGTILIEKSGGSPTQAAGRVAYCDRDFKGTASNFIEVVKIKDSFSPRYTGYLLYYLYHTGLVLKYQQQTTGIINFKLNEYYEELVSCPLPNPSKPK